MSYHRWIYALVYLVLPDDKGFCFSLVCGRTKPFSTVNVTSEV